LFELTSKQLFSLNQWMRTSETILISQKFKNSERFKPKSRIQFQMHAIQSDLELDFMKQEAAIEAFRREEREAHENRHADALQV